MTAGAAVTAIMAAVLLLVPVPGWDHWFVRLLAVLALLGAGFVLGMIAENTHPSTPPRGIDP